MTWSCWRQRPKLSPVSCTRRRCNVRSPTPIRLAQVLVVAPSAGWAVMASTRRRSRGSAGIGRRCFSMATVRQLVDEDAHEPGVRTAQVVLDRPRGEPENQLAKERRHGHGSAIRRQVRRGVRLDEDAVPLERRARPYPVAHGARDPQRRPRRDDPQRARPLAGELSPQEIDELRLGMGVELALDPAGAHARARARRPGARPRATRARSDARATRAGSASRPVRSRGGRLRRRSSPRGSRDGASRRRFASEPWPI